MTDICAMFTAGNDAHGTYWLAANGVAARLGAKMSKMKFRDSDMQIVRYEGYVPMLTDGTEIGKVDIKV